MNYLCWNNHDDLPQWEDANSAFDHFFFNEKHLTITTIFYLFVRCFEEQDEKWHSSNH